MCRGGGREGYYKRRFCQEEEEGCEGIARRVYEMVDRARKVIARLNLEKVEAARGEKVDEREEGVD
jgi:hypothetical protein